MMNKNVCPNCGQLYDTELSKCPLCGAVPQVVETEAPVQRKRITENERRQRRADRKEEKQEERLRRKEEQLRLDAEEERQIEAEEARRKEEKRRKKEEKKAARRKQTEAAQDGGRPRRGVSPMPARIGRPPEPVYDESERGRVPRPFLILSFLLLLAALVVGGSYLLWKLDVVKIPVYDKLAARNEAAQTEPADEPIGSSGESAGRSDTAPETRGDEILCREIRLDREEIVFDTAGGQTQLIVTLQPEETTQDRIFSSSDEMVVKVSPVGILTAMGPGEAVVTVSCGKATANCKIVCSFEAGEGNPIATVNVDHLESLVAGLARAFSDTQTTADTVIRRYLDSELVVLCALAHRLNGFEFLRRIGNFFFRQCKLSDRRMRTYE